MCELGIDFVETLILALPEIPDDEQLSALKGFWEVCFLKKDRYQIINVLCNYMIVYRQITLHFICCVCTSRMLLRHVPGNNFQYKILSLIHFDDLIIIII